LVSEQGDFVEQRPARAKQVDENRGQRRGQATVGRPGLPNRRKATAPVQTLRPASAWKGGIPRRPPGKSGPTNSSAPTETPRPWRPIDAPTVRIDFAAALRAEGYDISDAEAAVLLLNRASQRSGLRMITILSRFADPARLIETMGVAGGG
jgi:hypothetical protein